MCFWIIFSKFRPCGVIYSKVGNHTTREVIWPYRPKNGLSVKCPHIPSSHRTTGTP